MYTLRIITQGEDGAEERRNVYLGTAYDVLLKTPVKEGKSPERFNRAISEYYGIESTEAIDPTIIGFIYSEGVHPLRDYEVVYIVNNEGKTIERVYGIYCRH